MFRTFSFSSILYSRPGKKAKSERALKLNLGSSSGEILLFFWLAFFLLGCHSDRQRDLKAGMRITESTVIKKGEYYFPGRDSLHPQIVIEGSGITVDFNGARLRGDTTGQLPNTFRGLGILVRGEGVTLKNLSLRGYKVGVMAEGVTDLRIENADLSYNYRQRLRSTREREDLSDWLSYHDNEADEWLRYGAALYLKNCAAPVVKDVRVTGGQNGIMMTGCNDGLVYNNLVEFNSGIGIGLYRSSRNRIMHNRLDWNVRGYSHGFYSRGQDSAGILCYEQSNDNIFAFNSATHSGDGFFLWAGRETMDSGQGGCNGNVIYKNDFSHAPTNGVEVTFSRNEIIANRMEECRYGIWGGYSYETLILGNQLRGNECAIAIEHGQNNDIVHNYLADNETGIRLWEREQQPPDWGYAQRRDVQSRDYAIRANIFTDTDLPLHIEKTANVRIRDNSFHKFGQLLQAAMPPSAFEFTGNRVHQTGGWQQWSELITLDQVYEARKTTTEIDIKDYYGEQPVAPLPDGMSTEWPEGRLRGRKYILVDEWGPYDFRYPTVRLREVQDEQYVFLLLGPSGNWRLNGGRGFTRVTPKTGAFPATVTASKDPEEEQLALHFEFIGDSVTTRFGKSIPRGETVAFQFERYTKQLDWWVRWCEYDETTDPLQHYEQFRKLKQAKAGREVRTTDLAYRWYQGPGGGIDADRFCTFAETTFTIDPGRYRIELTSDDGVRLYLDGKRIIDQWEVRVPATDVVEVEMGGRHTLELEHFEAGGLATLSFRMMPVKIQ